MTLKYIPETKIEKVDKLSKRLDWKVGVENNNNNQTLIKNYWIYNLVEIVIKEPEIEIVERIKKAKDKDKEIVRVVEKIKKAEVKVL